MNDITRVLLWREWRERRGQLLVCLLWMLCGTAYVIAYAATWRLRTPVASFYTTASLFGTFMPVFLAMRTSLGELTDRTRAFSDSLPISARLRGWIRLAGGASVLIAPILLCAILLSICLASGWLEQAGLLPSGDAVRVRLPQRPSLSPLAAIGFLWQVTAIVVWSACGLFVLLSIIGTKLRAESHVGFVGAAVAILWMITGALRDVFETQRLYLLADWIGVLAPQGMILNFGYVAEHGGHYGDLDLSGAVFAPLAINAVVQLALGALFVRLYGKKLPRRTPIQDRATTASARLRLPWAMPLPTRGLALVWLGLRQSVPMCLPGLIIACLLTPLQMSPMHPADPLHQQLADSLPSSMWIVGLLWSVVVGAGLFASEIDARLGEFWRKLPIATWRLFVVKFIIGLMAVLLVLDGFTIAASWYSPRWGEYRSMNWPYIAVMAPLHATMFAVAVAWTCVLRRAVLGGMAAIVSFSLMSLIVDWFDAIRNYDPIEVYNNLHELGRVARAPVMPDFTAHGYPLVATVMACVLIASIIIGWLALRRYRPRFEL